ncbi:MAG: segregation/condensation protein A [Firmicutes bacterium]|nr:segregation/condensation protein A [Bacillota bacterium]
MSELPDEPFRLQLHSFEGPLDLLLHLIERDELDIYEIPIARVTDQYLALLHDSLDSHMEVASEFIVMAATLIALKARSLLPRPEPTQVQLQCDLDAEYVDPEWELTQRLLEYRAYKQVSQQLQELQQRRSQVVGRMPLVLDAYRVESSVSDVLSGVTLETLTAAFERALQRVVPVREVSVVRDRETVADRMRRIERQLQQGRLLFADLLTRPSRREIVTVFLAILELMRMNKVICYQEGLFGALWIDRRLS